MLTVRRNSTTVECVELAEIKTFLRIDFTQFDSVLNTCIVAARQWVENYTSTFWAKGEATVTISGITGYKHNTYWGGFVAITDDNDTGATITQDAADYAYVALTTDAGSEYEITVSVGTETPPQDVRSAIMMVAAQMYTSQTGEVTNTAFIKTMLMPYRKHLFL